MKDTNKFITMKKLSILGLLIIALIGFNSCKGDDDVVFVANEGDIEFTNSFLSEYVLTPATAGNLGERFTWNTPNTGVPVNQVYELQSSLLGDFSDINVVGQTSGNEYAITIGDLLGFAAAQGLDADPETEAPNTGEITFRVVATVGTEGSLEAISTPQVLNMMLPEDTGGDNFVCEYDALYLVGAGVPNAGWSWDTPEVISCSGTGVYSGNVFFTTEGDANFRFFTTATDWASGLNFPYFVDAGYTIDAVFEEAPDDDLNFKFIGTTGLYYLTVDTIGKTITVGEAMATGTCDNDQLWMVGAGLPNAGWSWDTPDFVLCQGTGVYVNRITFTNEGDANFRFFTTATDWASGLNFPYFVDEGYTIDPVFEESADDDLNFKFIGESGEYRLTVDTIGKTITVE